MSAGFPQPRPRTETELLAGAREALQNGLVIASGLCARRMALESHVERLYGYLVGAAMPKDYTDRGLIDQLFEAGKSTGKPGRQSSG